MAKETVRREWEASYQAAVDATSPLFKPYHLASLDLGVVSGPIRRRRAQYALRQATVYLNAEAFAPQHNADITIVALHEGFPGHHLMLGGGFADPSRAHPVLEGIDNTAAVEGWGDYAVALGAQRGLFDTPDAAARYEAYFMESIALATVELGVRASGWTADAANDTLAALTGLAAADRPHSIGQGRPGRHLAYVYGRTRIAEASARAQARLGPRFKPHEFHDLVLKAGPIPIVVLEAIVDIWAAG